MKRAEPGVVFHRTGRGGTEVGGLLGGSDGRWRRQGGGGGEILDEFKTYGGAGEIANLPLGYLVAIGGVLAAIAAIITALLIL